MTEVSTSHANADPGDLGRRLVERRLELGLSREEVASRAGMDPGYLRHVEEEANARPSPAACARLAVVLQTSEHWLRGGGMDRPPGGGRPDVIGTLEVLEPAECLERLSPGGVGRVVFDEPRGPVALPVNYRLVADAIYFRTGTGSIATVLEQAATVSMEVDHLDESRHEGWSVLVTGTASVVTDSDELARVEAAGVEPWAGGDRHLVGKIPVTVISGRRIRASGS
ncbi:MAG: pyridoxamine 5'-phosphate oxidase family protein [Actinomycetota bacterium]|jgi:nitroimidazol reductase NimA-like FMN-containing flavoprotein (pyridoxamine 5'-phosphate oxidase superfamily)|nr:pyridoxamine 5'-phosphate oxidase family protein [Actinomycetota bacterium]